MSEIAGIDPSVPPSGDGLRRVRRRRRLVVPPAPLRPVRAHRLLRHLALAARDRARPATGHPFIRSFEPGEDWFWSYETKEIYEGPELAPPQHHPVDQAVPGPRAGCRATGSSTCTTEQVR